MSNSTVTGTTNNGWDLVAGMNSSALSQFAQRFVPKTFSLTIDSNTYDISTKPNATTATISENNIISATLQITGTPQNGGTKFSGTTTIELNASQIALNKITQKNYLQLDGSEMSYLSSTSTDSLNSDTGFTMEAWVQTTNKGTQQIIMSYGSGSTFSPMFSINKSDQLELSWSTNSVSQTSDSLSNSNLWDGNWHHVAVSVSSTSVTFYLDGLEKGTTTISSKLLGGATTFNIGGMEGQTSYFTGNLTDLRVWNVTRTTAQIQQYMNVDLGAESGLLELWTFTGDANNPVNQVNTSQVGSLLNKAEVVQQSVASSIVYVNFLTTDTTTLKLTVTSVLSDESLETDFNSAFTNLLTTKVIPYAQQIKLNLNFGAFSLVVKPTHWNFATIYNSNTSDYQLLALSMFSNTVSPWGDQSSVFEDDTAILVPKNDSNLIVSFYDYRILKDLENFLVDRTNLFSEDDFSLDPSDNPVVLGLSKPLNVFRLFFLRLSKFNFKIDSQGINFLISLCTPILNLRKLQATLNAEAKTKSSSLFQDINLTFTEIDSPPIRWWIYWIFAVIFLVLLVVTALVYSGGNILLAIGGAIVAIVLDVLLYIYLKNNLKPTVTPSLFTITMAVIILTVGIIFFSSGTGLFVILAAAAISIVIGYIIYILINQYAASFVYSTINKFLKGFDKTVKFTNPNFTINDIVYNQAIIVQGLFGNADIDMSLINPDTNNQIVYKDYEAKLQIQLTNNSGTAIELNTGTTNPTQIQIEMPSFLSSDLQSMNIALTDWSYQLVDSTLTLTNVSATSWEPGPDSAIIFEITGITSTYNSITTGFVKVNVINAYTNEIQLQARLSNSTSAPPKTYTISWTVTYNSNNGLDPFKPPTSGTAQVTPQSNAFFSLASTELSDGTLDYYLGYQFNTTGLQAGWAKAVPNPGSNPAVIYRWNGSTITPKYTGPDNNSQSYYQNKQGPANDPNTNINIYFKSSNNGE